MPPFPGALIPTPCFHTFSHTPLRSQCNHVLLLQTFFLHLPRFKPPNVDLGWSRGWGAGLLLGRGITGRLEHKLFHHTQPSSMVFGWAGLAAGYSGGKDTCGRVLVGSPAARPSGGRLAPQGCFTSLRQKSSGERFLLWGAARLQISSRWRRIPAPLSKDTLTRFIAPSLSTGEWPDSQAQATRAPAWTIWFTTLS